MSTQPPTVPSTEYLGNRPRTSSRANENVKLPAQTEPPSSNEPHQSRVWLIYGASDALARHLITTILGHGDKVCAVNWSTTSGNTNQSPTTKATSDPSLLILSCQIHSSAAISEVFTSAQSHFSPLPISIILVSTLPSSFPTLFDSWFTSSPAEYTISSILHSQLDSTFFSTLRIIQSVVPYFRAQQNAAGYDLTSDPDADASGNANEQGNDESAGQDYGPSEWGSGRIMVLSSVAAITPQPGQASEAACRAAIEGLIESLHWEVQPFGIKSCLIVTDGLPVPSRNSADDGENADISMDVDINPDVDSRISTDSAYAHSSHPVHHNTRIRRFLGNKQTVDTDKAAELVWQLGHCTYPPLRFCLGRYAVDCVRDRLRGIIEEMEGDWQHLHSDRSAGRDRKQNVFEDSRGEV